MLPQPLVECEDRSVARLDDLLGSGFAIIGWDSPAFREAAHRLAPFTSPVRTIGLIRADEDFLGAGREGVIRVRDPSGFLDRFLDRLNADALVVRPDRFWSRIVRGFERP
jgi:3-(3-hydroxy-phenyl)propionate hydroxylase